MPEVIAEVPGAIWIPAHTSRYRLRPQVQPDGPYSLAVIHITSGHENFLGTVRMFQRAPGPNEKPSSAHFVVGRRAGELVQCVSLRFAAFHAHSANNFSVGIEHAVRESKEFGPDDPGMPPTQEMYVTSSKLVAYLLKAAGKLPVHHGTIKGHNEADPQTTHTGCPDAGGWNWLHYMAMVEAEYAALGVVAPIV